MNQKLTKQIKRKMRQSADKLSLQFLQETLKQPFKIRLKIAIKILRGSHEKQTVKQEITFEGKKRIK